jgi:hypothetical protein
MDHREILRQQIIAPDHSRLCPMLAGQFQKRLFQLCRTKITGRRVDQVTRQAFARGNRLDPRRVLGRRGVLQAKADAADVGGAGSRSHTYTHMHFAL